MREELRALREVIPPERLFFDESMARHTTFRVGGPADCFARIDTERELAEALVLCRTRALPFVVVGKGSNLLVADAGFRGAVLCTAGGFSAVELAGSETTDGPLSGGDADGAATLSVRAEAGATLAAVAGFARDHGLTGLEFAAGIPGTVGGGIIMNAGAYGGELGDVTASVRTLDADGQRRTRSGEEMGFSYRASAVKGSGEIVAEAVFTLRRGDREEIGRAMEELAERRRRKQPLDLPSAGSTWKRPEGLFAAKLIEEAGCKGLSVGGAQISEKHAGFLVNRGGASAADIRALMREVEARVLAHSGVQLVPEIVMAGEFAS